MRRQQHGKKCPSGARDRQKLDSPNEPKQHGAPMTRLIKGGQATSLSLLSTGPLVYRFAEVHVKPMTLRVQFHAELL